MEFAVALFGAVAGAALSKLNGLDLSGKADTSARSIRTKLTLIQSTLRDERRYASNGHASFLQTECIALLRDLAGQIEDCLDRIAAKIISPKDIAKEIERLNLDATGMIEDIMRFIGPIAEGVVGTEQVAGRTARAADVPIQLQHLLDDPSLQEWLVKNLNCLLYFCLFPRDHHVRTEPLIRRWLAEGLVLEEESAVKMLDNLINCSLLTGSIHRSNNGKVKTCQPIDVMFQYISRRSMSENFILLCDGTAQLHQQPPRRLSVYPSANGKVTVPQNRKLSVLRTLAVFTASATSPSSYDAVLDFDKYEVLRVLDLEQFDQLEGKHLKGICKQKLLKYLSINMGIRTWLHSGFGDLTWLETLDLSGTEIVTLQKEILMLPMLKHLLGKIQISLTNGIAIFLSAYSMGPLGDFLATKSKLETVAGFVASSRIGFPQLMSLMRFLRKVKIWVEYDANLEVLQNAIGKFIRGGTDAPASRSLSIDLQRCNKGFVSLIDGGQGSLASLKLRGELIPVHDKKRSHNKQETPMPTWKFLATISAIQELCLWSTGLSWKDILDGLSKVQGLKYLELIEDNLGSLQIVSAVNLRGIERMRVVCKRELEIEITAEQLPVLVSLHIICRYLQPIPGTSGIDITGMNNLKEVALHPLVYPTIKSAVEQAANVHQNRPVVLYVE